jgi:hypothetical protein
MRVTNGYGTNTEYLSHSPKKPTETNETMKFRRSREDSYSIGATTDTQKLEFTSYYSTDPKIKDHNLEKTNATVTALTILQAETPKHLHDEFPDYITFFVFVQASPDQKATDTAPLYNDAVCTINLIKGTGLDHNGLPMEYDGSGGNGGTTGGGSTGGGTTGGGTTGGGTTGGGTTGGGTTGGGTTGGGTTGGGTTGGGTTGGGLNDTALDIVFVQDCTGSQQPYIKAATDGIINISTRIASSAKLAPDALRLSLIGFRDAGDEFVTKPFPFTTDVSVMRSNLSTLVATGGGDGPEAVAEALDAALLSEWRVDATKLVILITDAPPHGIGEPTDSSPGGSPTGKEPLKIVRRMAELGITLHLIACEPTLSTTYKYAYDFYKALTKITGGLVLPLVSAGSLADYIIGSSLERVELDALVAADGKTIARRALFKEESPETLTDEYHAKYVAAGVAVTTLDIEPVYAEYAEGVKNVETYEKAADVPTARPLADVPGARLLPKFAGGSVSPSVTLAKKLITKEQTGRVIKLGITKNAEVLASGKFVARPTSEDPTKNALRINVPAGWYGFVSGLSRAKYNQAIKLNYTEDDNTNTEFMTSEFGMTDDIMRLTRTKEGFYVFAATEESNITLDTSFFWSRDKVKGSGLDKSQYTSQKLKAIRTQTPMHSLAFFPDYITYFIMAEDQTQAEQVAGVPDFNDCVGIVNLIKKTLMVYNDDD